MTLNYFCKRKFVKFEGRISKNFFSFIRISYSTSCSPCLLLYLLFYNIFTTYNLPYLTALLSYSVSRNFLNSTATELNRKM